jgi:hypothetical protein
MYKTFSLGRVASNFDFGNLRLYRVVKMATDWRLDIQKSALKYRIASARQSNTTYEKSQS